ncbi:hypothetical protein ACTA71_002033 [Dictyostelium dimigraforme]
MYSNFTAERLHNLASLAMITIPEDKVPVYRSDISEFLDSVESLQSVNTDKVEPLHSILVDSQLSLTPIAPPEKIKPVTRHSSAAQSGFFSVPKQISSYTNSQTANNNIDDHDDLAEGNQYHM